ncbi:hypothetical protein EC912_104393 [Luteibacter rhizovicinus]|uniref:Uncharacterized protein n=1 Tax=Luteibacter rhizovicinus TaxID=242606 RepID=A0A4R3YMZ9_9GAMM|nr:hypothetical protein [Luteibacter rhizovicinus]TCV94195.1 hypothetical protein EC912_104393 [Luteibacter rhizovicinus]
MRPTKRLIALGLTSVLLAACGHKDKDAPLAFVPADTPYVLANLDVLDDDTRNAMIAQLNTQLPAQVLQMKAAADQLTAKGNAEGARLINALAAELDGKTIEQVAKNDGFDLKGRTAFFGLGLSPVARVELADPTAFEGLVGRIETAYGQKLETATVGGQSYRHVTPKDSGVQLILAVVGKQAVGTLLPADAGEPLVRQALGLDRPAKNIQDDGRLDDLAKEKGYKPYAVGQVDMVRLLPLIAGGKDPLFTSLLKHKAVAEATANGEPAPAAAPEVPASCQTDAARIASRVPSMSFGYTRLDAKHQDQRFDIALADDVTKAFSGLKVELPGLGQNADAPFDVSIALPMEQLRTFWTAQADAVAAKPFTCPSLTDLNDGFAKVGSTMQQAAIPPFGDIRGLRIVLDSFKAADPAAATQVPTFSGRIVIGTRNPAGLVALGQTVLGGVNLKLANDGKPAALPQNLTAMVGQPAWAAMSDIALAIGFGQGEDARLGDALKASTGDAGRSARMHLTGDMYRTWIDLMSEKAEAYAEATAASAAAADGTDADPEKEGAAAAQRSKLQFQTMRAQADRIVSVSAEAHVDDKGMVITGQSELK